jgi:DNA-directed RNA polymerase specialized sigma24 family protein
VTIDPLIRSRPVDDGELAALYRRHARRLVGLATAVTLDRSAADEVVHDAFAGLARHLPEVRDPVAYLQRSVVNVGIRVVRRRERARSLPVGPIEHPAIPEVDELWPLVSALPVQQRAVVNRSESSPLPELYQSLDQTPDCDPSVRRSAPRSSLVHP